MTLVWEIALGLALGALGAAMHLGVAQRRARLVVIGRRRALPLLLYPVGLLGPALAVLAAAAVSSPTVWSVPLGIFTLRSMVMRRVSAS